MMRDFTAYVFINRDPRYKLSVGLCIVLITLRPKRCTRFLLCVEHVFSRQGVFAPPLAPSYVNDHERNQKFENQCQLLQTPRRCVYMYMQ